MTTPLPRRRLLGLAGAGAAGLAAAGVAGALVRGSASPAPVNTAVDAVDFYGEHQAGILTPAQDRLHFVSFDVTTKDRGELVKLLKAWTAAAARMTRGQ